MRMPYAYGLYGMFSQAARPAPGWGDGHSGPRAASPGARALEAAAGAVAVAVGHRRGARGSGPRARVHELEAGCAYDVVTTLALTLKLIFDTPLILSLRL